MKRYMYHIVIVLAALLVADCAWGQTDRGTLPDPVDTDNSSPTILSSGIYTLTKDYKPGTDKRWNIKFNNDNTEVTVDLNGHTIDASGINRAVFNVVRGKLTIKDSKGGGKIINSTKSAIYVAPSTSSSTTKATCNFQGGTIQNCKPSDDNGGAFDIQPRGTVNMSGGLITECKGTNGAAVYVRGGSFNMTGGEIKGNKVNDYKSWTPPTGAEDIPTSTNTNSSRGGGIYVEAGTCTVSGGTISGNVAHSGGGVFVTSGATFSFTGGTIEGNYAVAQLGQGTGNGGGIYIEGGNSNCTINGGTIRNNRATRYGGGININGSTMTIPNCTISGNLASSGGGISMETSGSTLELKGCTLEGNIAKVSGSDPNGAYGGGGGIFILNGNLNMSENNSFQSNRTPVLGGGIYIKQGKITVSGGISTFTNNQSQSGGAIYHAAGNITVNQGATLNLGGNSTEDGNKSTNHGGGIYCAGIITANGTTNIMYNSAGTHGGGIYCTGSFISNGNSTIQNNIAGSDGGGIYMQGDAIKLEGNTTNITANSSSNFGGALYVNQGIISIKGVSSINNNNAKSGGAVYLNKGSMTTSGTTTVSGNYSTIDGGAVYVYAGKVEMENPTITGNGKNGSLVATSRGGAIFISGLGAEFTATGTSDISSNAATSDGGAIYVQGGNVNLEKNTISSNTANTGGAVFLRAGTLNTTVSALVRNNYAITNGGAFYVVNGQVQMENPTIADNGKDADGVPVTKNGGAIFVLLDANYQGEVSGFKATGTSVVNSNASTISGGAICVKNGDVQFSRNTISSNFSKAGGAVYLVGGSLKTTDASTVKDNYSTTNGGAFYVENGKVEMENPTITGNGKNGKTIMTQNGGAIYVIGDGAGFQATGQTLAKIEDNAASANGAAVYVSGGNISISNPTEMSGNVAGLNGGVAYVRNGAVTLSANTTMYQNEAKEGSGGVFYVEKSIDYTGTVGVTTKTGIIQKNKSGANGGVFCVNGGNINLEGITTMLQNSAVNGGAIAIYNGTFSLHNESQIKENTATYGGGLYVNNTASHKTISCEGGTFLKNTAQLGGGIYASGDITLTFAANVEENLALNGGGLYLDNGIYMKFGNGLIVKNEAKEAETATRNSSTSGVGGGIYLAKGKLSFTERANLGIYNNVAAIQAADIYSSGSDATVELPYVKGMNLTGFDVPGSELYWVRDFSEQRYEAALRDLNINIEDLIEPFTDAEISATYKTITSETCLDLGYDLVFVTLSSFGLVNYDNAAINIAYQKQGITDPVVYRKVLFTGEESKIVGLPSGDWQFEVTEWSKKYKDPTIDPSIDANGFLNIKRNHNQNITITFEKKHESHKAVTFDAKLLNRMYPGGAPANQ